MTLDHTKVPGSTIMVLGIAGATDEFAERDRRYRPNIPNFEAWCLRN
jgi:hypothetical protein